MTALYVDASAAAKLHLVEDGADLAADELDRATALISSTVLEIEVGAALHRRLADPDRRLALDGWDDLWRQFHVVAVDEAVVRHALSLAQYHGLGTLDAIHLASALRVPGVPMHFITWDRALAEAARAVGLRVLPVD